MPEPIETEEQALIERMVASVAFSHTRGLPELLRFLYTTKEKKLSADDIEKLHYRKNAATADPNHARERTSKLRGRISSYHAERPEETLRCELPKADEVGGYQLIFTRATESPSARRRFWAAHVDSGKIMSTMCDPLLFFFDFEELKAFRYMDTNIEGLSRDSAKDTLKKLHENEYKESLIPGHVYIDIGSVQAAELIRQYFRSVNVDVPLVIDKEGRSQWWAASPVIISNPRTSFDTKYMFLSPDTKDFAYRVLEERFAGLNIVVPRPEEIVALRAIGAKIDQEGNFMTPSAEKTIGIVTRMPNPHGAGAMTFIISDGTYTTMGMAAALVDETQTRAIFTKMGWRLDQPVPDSFELMFLVTLWPGGMADKSSQAKLLFGRSG